MTGNRRRRQHDVSTTMVRFHFQRFAFSSRRRLLGFYPKDADAFRQMSSISPWNGANGLLIVVSAKKMDTLCLLAVAESLLISISTWLCRLHEGNRGSLYWLWTQAVKDKSTRRKNRFQVRRRLAATSSIVCIVCSSAGAGLKSECLYGDKLNVLNALIHLHYFGENDCSYSLTIRWFLHRPDLRRFEIFISWNVNWVMSLLGIGLLCRMKSLPSRALVHTESLFQRIISFKVLLYCDETAIPWAICRSFVLRSEVCSRGKKLSPNSSLVNMCCRFCKRFIINNQFWN